MEATRRQRGLVQDRCLEMELWLSMKEGSPSVRLMATSASVMVNGNDAIGRAAVIEYWYFVSAASQRGSVCVNV